MSNHQTNYQPNEIYRPTPQSDSTILFFHEVKPGETITDIAKQYSVSTADIIKWNKLNNSNLTEGSTLKIYISE